MTGSRDSTIASTGLAAEADRERQRLALAVASLPVGLSLFDADSRLVVCNRLYAKMYDLPESLARPGTSWNDLIEHWTEAEAAAGGDPAHLLAYLSRIPATRTRNTETLCLPNGRAYSVVFQPVEGGGWIATHEDITARRNTEQRIARLSEEAETERRRLVAAVGNMPIGLVMYDTDRRLIIANARYQELYHLPDQLVRAGTAMDEILKYRIGVGEYSGSDPAEWTESIHGIAERGESATAVREMNDGRMISVIFQPLENGGWVATHEDVTERCRAEKEIVRLGEEAEVERRRLNAAVGNMPIGLVMFDSEMRLIVANPRYAEMYRLPKHLARPGTSLKAILENRVRAGDHAGTDAAEYVQYLLDMVERGQSLSDVIQFRDGRIFSRIYQPMEGGGWVSTHEDITDRSKAQAQIAYMTNHDYLTDLPNRVHFLDEVEEALLRDGNRKGIAVLCLDLDRFKGVNDSLGHPIGDKLLQAVARRLANTVREGDCVARLGGDEFAALQVGLDQPTGARALAHRIIDELGAPFTIDGHQIIGGASIGIALAPSDGSTANDLLKSGDMALYRAKADGRGLYRFFEPEMDARMQARRSIEMDLRGAIERREFELYFQPQVNLETSRITGFEALIRWHHPRRGMVFPLEFIPAAEETGLIEPIGEWVLDHACAVAARWPSDVKVAVNLSPAQFRTGRVLQAVVSALVKSGLPAQRLELEITENVLLGETEATLSLLNQLHTLGVAISMDDFGTGYSSLSYLQKFRFDKIKIDRQFIKGIGEDEKSLAIIKAVTGLSASMGIATIAEGVETEEQLACVKREGCTEVQGFLTGRPMPATEAMALLLKRSGGFDMAAA